MVLIRLLILPTELPSTFGNGVEGPQGLTPKLFANASFGTYVDPDMVLVIPISS